MVEITYLPSSGGYNWDNPFVWSGGTVPDSPTDTVSVASSPDVYATLSILSGETFTIGSLFLYSDELFALDSGGSLSVVDTLDLATGADFYVAGSVNAGSAIVDATANLYGKGTLTTSGVLDNAGQIETNFGDLIINAGSLINTGLIGGSETISTPTGGFLKNGAMTSGLLLVDNGDVMKLDVGESLVIDAGTIDLQGGIIESLNPATNTYQPIEQTLGTVAAGGTLNLSHPDYWGSLTVAGVLNAQTFSALDLTITNQGTVFSAAIASQSGTILNSGTIVVSGNTFTSDAAFAGSGTLVLTGTESYQYIGGYNFESVIVGPFVDIAHADQNNVDFQEPAGELEIDQPATFTGEIIGFSGPGLGYLFGVLLPAPGASIFLPTLAYDAITSISYTGTTERGVLAIVDGGSTVDLNFLGDYTLQSFDFVNSGGDILIEGAAPCFARGTLISTEHGDVPVEDLVPGMRATLETGALSEIIWIGRRKMTFAMVDASDAHPVRIRAGALGSEVPKRDLVLSPDHAVYLDGVLVPASLLINGTTICHEPCREIIYYHVELERHAILLAEGAAVESYLDTGNRQQYGNCPLAYDPCAATEDPCAEMILAGRRLAEIRARLAESAPGEHVVLT